MSYNNGTKMNYTIEQLYKNNIPTNSIINFINYFNVIDIRLGEQFKSIMRLILPDYIELPSFKKGIQYEIVVKYIVQYCIKNRNIELNKEQYEQLLVDCINQTDSFLKDHPFLLADNSDEPKYVNGEIAKKNVKCDSEAITSFIKERYDPSIPKKKGKHKSQSSEIIAAMMTTFNIPKNTATTYFYKLRPTTK